MTLVALLNLENMEGLAAETDVETYLPYPEDFTLVLRLDYMTLELPDLSMPYSFLAFPEVFKKLNPYLLPVLLKLRLLLELLPLLALT